MPEAVATRVATCSRPLRSVALLLLIVAAISEASCARVMLVVTIVSYARLSMVLTFAVKVVVHFSPSINPDGIVSELVVSIVLGEPRFN